MPSNPMPIAAMPLDAMPIGGGDATGADPTAQHAGGRRPVRLAVPWTTVVPLAAVMAYADGFWMTSLRGAVGAIERSQTPFASWWRESTLVLPVFIFAVLAALTLALRWFGPALQTWKAVVATVLLVVAAGTIVGLAEMVASAVYDYHLQSAQLRHMDAMHSLCATSCFAQEQHATLMAHVRGFVYVSRWVLLTNLALVAWLVALRGGRLKISSTPRRHFGRTPGTVVTGTRVKDVRLLLAVALLATASIHAAVIPQHLNEWGAAGAFFILLAAAEAAVATALLTRPRPAVLLTAAAISLGPLVLWLYSRTAGMPFGPAAGTAENIGVPDSVACALEIGSLLAAAFLLRPTQWLLRRPPLSAHLVALTLVAMLAVTAIGLAGTGPSWFDVFPTSGDQSQMMTPH